MEFLHLNDMTPGRTATVTELKTQGSMRRRLLDIGLVPGTPVECLGQSPGGDPKAYLIRGAAIAIRQEDAESVILRAGVDECPAARRRLRRRSLPWRWPATPMWAKVPCLMR